MATRQNLTDKKISNIRNFLQDKVGAKAANGFSKSEDKLDWLERHWSDLEEYEGWTDEYSSIEDLTMAPEKKMEEIYNKSPDFSKISDAKMKSILKKNDFSEDDLEKYYQFREDQRRAVEEINRQRYEDASKNYGQVTRAKDDSYFNSKVANELARKAHIEGDETKAYIQEALGKTAGAADFAPFPFSLAGPAIRVGQKIYGDEPVEVLPTIFDVGGAIIPDFLEKPAKVGYGMLKSKLGKGGRVIENTKFMKDLERSVNADEIEAAQKVAKEELERLKNINPDNLTEKELLDLHQQTQNPAIKAKLEAIKSARGQKSSAVMVAENPKVQSSREGRKAASSMNREADEALDAANADYIKTVANEEPKIDLRTGDPTVKPFSEAGDLNPRYKDVSLEDLAQYERSMIEPDWKAKAVKLGLHFGGRGLERNLIQETVPQKYDFMPKDTRESDIKWLINTYGNSWSPMFAPEEASYDPMVKEAYERWLNDPNQSYSNWLKKNGGKK